MHAVCTKNQPCRFSAPSSQETGKADNFTAPHTEGYILNLVPGIEAIGLQQDIANFALAAAKGRGVFGNLRNVAAQHAGHKFNLANRFHVGCLDGSAVAHDRDAITNFIKLIQLVADEDDGNTFPLQLAYDIKQNFDFALIQRRGWFVHDDQARLEANGPRNGNHLLGGCVEFMQWPAHIDGHVEPGQQASRLVMHHFPIQQAIAALFAAQANVFCDGTKWNQIDFLIDGADALGLRVLWRARLKG